MFSSSAFEARRPFVRRIVVSSFFVAAGGERRLRCSVLKKIGKLSRYMVWLNDAIFAVTHLSEQRFSKWAQLARIFGADMK